MNVFGFRRGRLLAAASLVALATFSGGKIEHKNFKINKNLMSHIQRGINDLIKMNSAKGQNIAVQSIINSIRYGVGMVMGYSDRTAYVALVCDGTDPGNNAGCDGPPQAGIVGTITGLVNTLPTIASNGGITSCESVPSSGSVTGSDGNGNTVTLTFGTPTHTIPSTWINGGATFSKRVVFDETVNGIGPNPTALGIAFEFNCGDSSASYAAISMAVDGVANYNRDIAIYNGPVDSSQTGIEVFMAEHLQNSNTSRTVEAYKIYYDASTEKFQLWGVDEANISVTNNDLNVLAKLIVHGDYNSGEASVYYDAIVMHPTNDGINGNDPAGENATSFPDIAAVNLPGTAPTGFDMTSDLTSGSFATESGSVTGDSISFGSPVEVKRQGCLNFSDSTTALTSNALCSGLALASPPDAPAVASTGAMSIEWALTLGTVLEHVN